VSFKFINFAGVDIDECATNNGGCSSDADCSNPPCSFTCTCHVGYNGDGYTCNGKSTRVGVVGIVLGNKHPVPVPGVSSVQEKCLTATSNAAKC